MNDNDRKDAPAGGEEGRARHGERSDVSWDAGKGRQPYANREEAQPGPAAAPETEAGNRGEASGRNLQELEAVQRKPQPAPAEAPRQDVTGRGDVR